MRKFVRLGTTRDKPSQQPTFSPFGLQQRFDQSVASVIRVATVSGDSGIRLEDTNRILEGRVDVLRVYLPLEALPLDWLDMLLYHFGRKHQSYIREIQFYIRSCIRSCLLDIKYNSQFAQGLSMMAQDWMSLNTTVKFFFHRLDAVVQNGRDRKQDFHEKHLITAIEALPEGGVALTDILGEESRVDALPEVRRSIEIEIDDEYL
ncbi:hypothetical protein NX059_004734 [Plenodomus lindquistii]|nr:hypothetical protein NX059_004734 [Plenodomus lindquistii]